MPAEKLGRAFVLNFLPDKKQTAEDAITLDEGFHKMGFKVTTATIKSSKVRHRFTPPVSIISQSTMCAQGTNLVMGEIVR